MILVKNKKELEDAIKLREAEVAIKGIVMKLACKGAAKFQKVRNPSLNMLYGAFSETATIAVIVIAAITGLAIIAMCKKYDVEIDYNEGKVKFKYNNVDMFLH